MTATVTGAVQYYLSYTVLSRNKIINDTDEDNRADKTEEDVEACLPSPVIRDNAEAVHTDGASEIAEAVKDTRQLTRVYLTLELQGHHTYNNIIDTRHQRRNHREGNDGNNKRRYRARPTEGGGDNETHKQTRHNEHYGTSAYVPLDHVINLDRKDGSGNCKKGQEQGQEDREPVLSAVEGVEDIGGPGGKAVLDEVIYNSKECEYADEKSERRLGDADVGNRPLSAFLFDLFLLLAFATKGNYERVEAADPDDRDGDKEDRRYEEGPTVIKNCGKEGAYAVDQECTRRNGGTHNDDSAVDLILLHGLGEETDKGGPEEGHNDSVDQPEELQKSEVGGKTYANVHGTCDGKAGEYHVFYVVFLAHDSVYDLTDSVSEEKEGGNEACVSVEHVECITDRLDVSAVAELADIRAGIYYPTEGKKQS